MSDSRSAKAAQSNAQALEACHAATPTPVQTEIGQAKRKELLHVLSENKRMRAELIATYQERLAFLDQQRRERAWARHNLMRLRLARREDMTTVYDSVLEEVMTLDKADRVSRAECLALLKAETERDPAAEFQKLLEEAKALFG